MKKLIILSLTLLLFGCGYANLDFVKKHANTVWNANGFEVIGYDGYQWANWFGGSYGGACVWYKLKRIPDNGILYEGCLQRWGDEIHIYNNEAIDAIKPKGN